MNIYENIMNNMDNIEYGFKDEQGFNLINDTDKWNKDFYKFYYLLDPNETLDKRCGVCWDQVELERYLFNINQINCNTYFIYIDNHKELPSHTFLVFIFKDKYYWFEHSWYDFKGIHEYTSFNNLLEDVKSKFIQSQNGYYHIGDKLYIYEYNKPNYHLSCIEFYKFMNKQNKIEDYLIK